MRLEREMKRMRSSSGFTLIEVMVAVAIMAVIMALLWSSTSQSLSSKERIENRDMVFHAGGVAMRKISEDLEMAFLARTLQQPQPGQAVPSPAEAAAPGVEPFKSFFIGKDNGDADSVSMTSFAHLRLFKDSKEADQCKVAYEVVQSGDEPGRMDLVRREDVWLDTTTDVKGDPVVLAEGIKAFNLEYYDQRKGEWVKGWNTEQQDWQGRLPLSVRVSMTFPDPGDPEREIPMSTAVMLPLSRGVIEF